MQMVFSKRTKNSNQTNYQVKTQNNHVDYIKKNQANQKNIISMNSIIPKPCLNCK